MQNLRVAIVGAGYMGSLHAQKLAACAGVELAAVVDPDRARGEALAARHGSSAYTAVGGALKGIDAAVVAAPAERHHAVVAECLEAGAHVLVEKPIATTLQEADALISLAARRRRVLQVGHVERHSAAWRALAARVERPLLIEAERLQGFKERGSELDVVLDLMIHDLDLALALADAEVRAVSARGFRVLTRDIDIANASIEFAGGCVANFSVSRVSRQPVRMLRVFQPGMVLQADLQAGSLRSVRQSGGAIEETEEVRGGKVDALAAQARSFVAAARGEAASAVSGEDGKRALGLALTVSGIVAERLGALGSTA